jgi:hypothetical protein
VLDDDPRESGHSYAGGVLAVRAASSAALRSDSSTSAMPDTLPPLASPRKFNVTVGLRPMLRIRVPG